MKYLLLITLLFSSMSFSNEKQKTIRELNQEKQQRIQDWNKELIKFYDNMREGKLSIKDFNTKNKDLRKKRKEFEKKIDNEIKKLRNTIK